MDENTSAHCLSLIEDCLSNWHKIQIESGETHKTLQTCDFIWKEMTAAGLDRNSLLINLGGGVIGDMGGFCAATYKRGIDFINIPTTLLSQVDASVGGKLGIDFHGFKNHIGLFREPNAILVDTTFLKTLPKRELRSGFAEIIKHSLIASSEQWNKLKLQSFDEYNFSELVVSSAEIKKQVVKEDPLESGKRKILNYGHTIGHAIESYFLETKSRLLHGEAIAIGMICEAFIANEKDLIGDKELQEITRFILGVYNKVSIEENTFEEIIELMSQDKKNKGNKILMALPDGIGRAVWDVDVSISDIKESISFYTSL